MKILGVTTAVFYSNLTHETFRWGPDASPIPDEELQAAGEETLIDARRQFAIIPVRLGGQLWAIWG